MKWVVSFFDFELFRTPSSPAQNVACVIANINAPLEDILLQIDERSLFKKDGLLEGVLHDPDFYDDPIWGRTLSEDVRRAYERVAFDVDLPAPENWRATRLDGATMAASGVEWTSTGKLCLVRDRRRVFEPHELEEAMAAARRLSPVLMERFAVRRAKLDELRAVQRRLDDDVAEDIWSDDDASEDDAPADGNSRKITLDMVTQLERDLAGEGIKVQLLADGTLEPRLYLPDLEEDPTKEDLKLLAEAQRLWARAKAETDHLGSWRAQYALARFDELAAAFKPKLLRNAYKHLDAVQASRLAIFMQFVATIRFDLANWDGLLLAPRPIAVLAASKPGFWTAGDEEAFRYYYKMARQTVDYHFQRSNTRAQRYFQRPDDPLFSRRRMDDSNDESSS